MAQKKDGAVLCELVYEFGGGGACLGGQLDTV